MFCYPPAKRPSVSRESRDAALRGASQPLCINPLLFDLLRPMNSLLSGRKKKIGGKNSGKIYKIVSQSQTQRESVPVAKSHPKTSLSSLHSHEKTNGSLQSSRKSQWSGQTPQYREKAPTLVGAHLLLPFIKSDNGVPPYTCSLHLLVLFLSWPLCSQVLKRKRVLKMNECTV